MTPRSALLGLLTATILGSCSFAPDYHTPKVEAPETYKETGDWVRAQPADESKRGPWWEIFGDPGLNALEAKVAGGNQNLKIALAQYDEARAAASVARADYFPTVTGNVGASRNHTSQTVTNATPISQYNDYTAGIDLNYEIDLWGRVRNAVKAAGDRAEASKADLAGVELSLRAELAEDYFMLRADDAAQAILDETVTAYNDALGLTRNRFQGGVVAEIDVDQAETQYQNAKTQASDMRMKRAQLEHAIAVLTGQVPAAFALAPMPLAIDAKPPVMTPGLPSTLLERRPDIAAAERRAEAANADIGVARAAWLPTFSLAGLLGFESGATGGWITTPSRFWSLGPSAVGTIFDAGRINALSDEARAAYDEAAATYRQSVLNAYQEVEDNLVALHRLAEESESQSAATAAAGRSLTQEQNRYTGGIVTYLDVVQTQNIALQAKLASVDILARRMTASVQLVKALGGGWQANELKKAEK